MDTLAHPPATLEGWYASHQLFRLPRESRASESELATARHTLSEIACGSDGSWSITIPLVGSLADVMIVHFRPTLEELGAAEQRVRRDPFLGRLEPIYTFLSVTEAGLYHITAQLAKDADARRGAVGDAEFESALAERSAAEADTPHVRRRLYPQPPADMPYVCFYPMSKRRAPDQNWYSLTLEERSRLMYSHGLVGRRYAGRVMQIITGAVGLDAWEWGVTLFAKDPLDFKKLVTEMRFDEASARYAEFGDFYVGRRVEAGEWPGEG
ncbi:MAG TPA: chlorite dismutase family protein [Gemmatimonadaceae bacterium]|jgi:chlorite dismutase|nr:chlorite dismutase family protein [Gemmatimonadaceae bacterium]